MSSQPESLEITVSKPLIFNKLRLAARGAPAIPIIILILFIFFGIFGGILAPNDPNAISLKDTLTPPFFQEGGTMKYPLGTDVQGRDLLSRMMAGASVSLQVGFIAVFLSGAIGITLAMLAGYLGKWADVLIMRVVDILLSLPFLLFAIVLAAILGPSKNNVILVLGLLGWASYTRILRSEVLRIKEMDFVRLAVVAGVGKRLIMWRHIFPNIFNTFVILATLQLGNVIITESSLSFLGIGVPPPDPSWGSMLANGRDYISSAWWICIWPGVAILLVVLSCNLIGDWLRVRLDPKFRQL
jgi:peptide/nickel transport system permease protein